MGSGEAFETAVAPVRWVGSWSDGHLEMLDQRLLPGEEYWHAMHTAHQVADGIRLMIIRGAPAIGIAAAFGVAMGVRELLEGDASMEDLEWSKSIDALFDNLADTRPTAVNLFWALRRMRPLVTEQDRSEGILFVDRLFEEADAIMREDRANNLTMGNHGAELFEQGARILTHCNTGGLATGGYGTALGVIRAVNAQGKLAHVWIDETRPYLQGARLTAWECLEDNIPSTLITDNMAAHFMQKGEVDAVIVGADRIGADGSTANKIGTYGLAVLCKHHGIPFYVAAPLSTIDLEIERGEDIPIEQRSAREVTHVKEQAIAPEGIPVAHPAFDVTPGDLVTAIITEKGVSKPPYKESLAALFDAE